jgi:hypothetical protein
MPKKSLTPSIREVAFDCPHCGAYTSQTWWVLHAKRQPEDSRLPGIVDEEALERIRTHPSMPADMRKDLLEAFTKRASGLVVLQQANQSDYRGSAVDNLNLSQCFSCGEISVWIYDRLVFPTKSEGPPPNEDLPGDVRADYLEAGKILNDSPRGAAALLRLALQKLCRALGEKGKTLDDDIASLVKKGLPVLVQKSLDSVRVIGNEAVHPGTLDLKDDRATAEKLFAVTNIIAQHMISNPKHVEELYGKLSPTQLKAIEKRDRETKPK